jgi:hypothetical protein
MIYDYDLIQQYIVTCDVSAPHVIATAALV